MKDAALKENDFLKTLLEKHYQLSKQVTALEETIQIFGGRIDDHDKDFALSLSDMPHTYMEPETELSQIIPPVNIPKTYSPDLTWEQKTLFGLYMSNNHSGTVYDILKTLNRYDHNITEEDRKTFRAITVHASQLGRTKAIKTVKIGNKHRYSI